MVLTGSFWFSGTDLGLEPSGAAAVLTDVLLPVLSVFWVEVVQGLLLLWACNASEIMSVTFPPPFSAGRVSESTLAEPSKCWTVASTPSKTAF